MKLLLWKVYNCNYADFPEAVDIFKINFYFFKDFWKLLVKSQKEFAKAAKYLY
jgi:hypothetical protein